MVFHSWHSSIAVPESVQMDVNLSVWLREEMVNHPTLKQLAKSLPHVLVRDIDFLKSPFSWIFGVEKSTCVQVYNFSYIRI